MAARDRYLLLFVLGLVLVLNPVYLFPGGVPHEEAITYRAEQVETVADAHRTLPASAILDCTGPIVHRECVQAHRIGYGGRLPVDNDTRVALEDDEKGLYAGYDYVRFPQGYAEPNASLDGGTLLLSLVPASREQILSRYAVPFEQLPRLGKRAIRNGTASTTRRITDFDDVERFVINEEQRVVNRSGTFYQLRLDRKVSRRMFPPWLLGVGRLVGVVGGAALAFVASGRYARRTVSTQGATKRE
ncbi:MAG: hypothetical protein ABEH66_02660 [Halobacteriales archaeon]